MRTLHVVVHPQATHHVEGVVGGWYDSDLTPLGLRDAEATAVALRKAIPAPARTGLFSSDLLRARRTADVIAKHLDATPVFDGRLREKSYGVAEGRPQPSLQQMFVPPPATGDRMSHDEGIAGAETKGVFAARIYAAMDRVLACPNAHQVVVTHGFALTFVVAAWVRMPLESTGYVNLRAEPGSITTLQEDDYFHNRQVVRLSDTRHLAPR